MPKIPRRDEEVALVRTFISNALRYHRAGCAEMSAAHPEKRADAEATRDAVCDVLHALARLLDCGHDPVDLIGGCTVVAAELGARLAVETKQSSFAALVCETFANAFNVSAQAQRDSRSPAVGHA